MATFGWFLELPSILRNRKSSTDGKRRSAGESKPQKGKGLIGGLKDRSSTDLRGIHVHSLFHQCLERGISSATIRDYLRIHPLPHTGEDHILEAWVDGLSVWRPGSLEDTAKRRTTDMRRTGDTQGNGCVIQEPSLRGITLPQIERIYRRACDQCERENWTSTTPGQRRRVRPLNMTVLDIVEYYIKPLTWARGVSMAEAVSSGPVPPEWFVSHWWGGSVKDLITCLRRHQKDRDLAPDATTYWVRTTCRLPPRRGARDGLTRARPRRSAPCPCGRRSWPRRLAATSTAVPLPARCS